MLLPDLNGHQPHIATAGSFPIHDRVVDVSFFTKLQNIVPRVEKRLWADLLPDLQRRDVRDEKDGPLLGGYLCTGKRCNADVPFKSLIQLDIDSARGPSGHISRAPDLATIRSAIDEYEWVAASSHGHDPANGMVKYRITLLPDRDILKDEHQFVMEVLNEKLQGCLDEKSWAWSQPYYLPSCPAATSREAFTTHNPGQAICVNDLVARGRYIQNLKQRPKSNSSQTLNSNIWSGLPMALTETPENVKKLQEALNKLDPDIGRPDWLSVIWSVAAHGWTCGKSLAESWSAKGTKYNKQTSFDRDWGDFNPSREDTVPAGRVYQMAKVEVPDALAANDNVDWLAEMNEKYCWIEREGGIYRRDHADFIDHATFRLQHENKTVWAGDKTISQATAWLKDRGRLEFKRLVLRPGEPEIVNGHCLNIWKGFAIQPVVGDVQPWLGLLSRMVPDPFENEFILNWLKQIIQNPSIKNNTALVVWSQAQGVGKNLLFECVRAIIGPKHSTTIGQAELGSRFTSWAEGKLFVIGDEVVGLDRRQDADKLKLLITGTTVQIEEKNQPRREMENFANFVFFSNHPDAVFIDNYDRRYFVVEVRSAPLTASESAALVNWRDNGGLSALLDYLQSTPIVNFDPKAFAPITASKSLMVEDNRTDLERWVGGIMSGAVAQLLGREVATAEELCNLFNQGAKRQATAKAMGNALQKVGAEKYPSQVTLADSRRVRVWLLANQQHWINQPASTAASEMQKTLKYF